MKPDNEIPWKHHQMSPRIPRIPGNNLGIDRAIVFLCAIGLFIYLVWG